MRPVELYGAIPDAIAFTERGFAIGRFLDRYGRKCSIQKSSLAEEDCIWLGSDEGSGDRMHLTQEMVADLLPVLQRFVETGELSSPAPTEEG